MSRPIRAIYEGGHLRLLDPVELAEGEEVNVTFVTDREALRAALGHLLVAVPPPMADFDDEAAQRELDEALKDLPPLSEYIIQERREGP